MTCSQRFSRATTLIFFEVIHKKLRLGIGRTETLISFKEVFKRPIPVLSENIE